MLYKSADEFFALAAAAETLSREEEKALSARMKEGDEAARKALIRGYLPLLASYLKRYTDAPSLHLIYLGVETLEEAVSSFDFRSENPTFTRFLGDRVRRMMTRYVADSTM